MSKRIDNLQALRGLAASAVLVAHLGALGAGFPNIPTTAGVFGVDVFFVLSGFIMCYVTRSTWGRVGRFVANRALRIYPLWWACLLVEAPWILDYWWKPANEHVGYVVRSLLLIPAVSPHGDLLPILVPGWTLVYEVAFYAVFAMLMLGARQWLVSKLLLVFGCALVGSFFLPAGSAAALFLGNPIYFEFAIGVLVANRFLAAGVEGRLVLAAYAIAVVVVGVAALTRTSPTGAFRALVVGTPAAAVLLSALYLEARALRAPAWLVFLGEASYSLYLTHTIAIVHAKHLVSGWAGLLALAALAIAVAVVVHICLERPLLFAASLVRRHGMKAPRDVPAARA